MGITDQDTVAEFRQAENLKPGQQNSTSKLPIQISQVIDLTDKPIRLKRDEIGWSRVRANASNCICCCCNSSITLVTTNESYILDHIPLDDINHAEASHNLKYLALSNDSKIAVIDLVNQENIEDQSRKWIAPNKANGGEAICQNCNSDANQRIKRSTKGDTRFVNIASYGVTMQDVLFWRWLDESTLAILTLSSLYTCSLSQPQINHPAMNALDKRTRLLSMEKVCDLDDDLSFYTQITDVQRDLSANYYAISGLYRVDHLRKLMGQTVTKREKTRNISISSPLASPQFSMGMRPSFGSVPSRLSQLVNTDHSFDSTGSENLQESSSWRRTAVDPAIHLPKSILMLTNYENDSIQGIVQIHCRMRECSQLILAHAVAYTTEFPDGSGKVKLVVAEKLGNRSRVQFVDMAEDVTSYSPGRHASQLIDFDDGPDGSEFPISIICVHQDTNHLAMITTKFGQLIVCSVRHETILFTTRIVSDIVSGVVIDSRPKGLMVICRNGRVLSVHFDSSRLAQLAEESKKKLRHISSCQSFLCASGEHPDLESKESDTKTITSDEKDKHSSSNLYSPATDDDKHSEMSPSLDNGLNILISTKL